MCLPELRYQYLFDRIALCRRTDRTNSHKILFAKLIFILSFHTHITGVEFDLIPEKILKGVFLALLTFSYLKLQNFFKVCVFEDIYQIRNSLFDGVRAQLILFKMDDKRPAYLECIDLKFDEVDPFKLIETYECKMALKLMKSFIIN